ncbi:MAG: multidrug DMT transporter permease [Acidobacteria bacterium]|nr:multidrug DMT transporter permease [Acidobacteriota bacterium]
MCLIWGTTYLAIRVALETIPPALVGGIRFTLAGGVLILLLRSRGEALPPRGHWPGLALLGLLMIVLGNGGVVWAEQWVPSGIAAVTVASTPFWMIGVEAALPHGERLSARVILGLSIGFGGILLLLWPDLTAVGAQGRRFAVGVGALQVACLGWTLGSSYSRRHAREGNALAAAAIQMILGGVMMLAIATARGEWRQLAFTPRTLAAEGYLIAFGSLAGYPAYVYALKYLPVSTVSLYAYVNPVIAVLLGTRLLAEPFGPRVMVATATVLMGIAVVRVRAT